MTLAVASVQNTTQATSTTIAAAAPAGIADGNLLMAYVSKNTTSAPSTVPAGWTLVADPGGPYRAGFVGASAANGGVTGGWQGFYKKIASGEAGSYTWGSTSATWSATLWRLTDFVPQTPGGLFLDAFMFANAKPVTRSTNTLASSIPPMCDLIWDRYMMLVGITQVVAATTTNFSALSASLTQDSYTAQSGISQITGHEYVDMNSNPVVGSRQCTTDQATGGSGGHMLLIVDPSTLSADVNPRHTRRRYGKNRLAA
jgi:hypothetical protein